MTNNHASSNNGIDCISDPTGSLKKMFVDISLGRRVVEGQQPIRRAVFLKPHGCVQATFVINKDLPNDYRIGVFQYDTLNAWVRFATDTMPGYSDLKQPTGIGIKLFGVQGKKLLEDDEAAQTVDFILQNHSVFFVDTAKDMCEFTYAGVIQHDYPSYLKTHPKTQQILDDIDKQKVSSVLESDYWSGLPYAFGDTQYVKYKIEPIQTSSSGSIPDNNPNYLHDELKQRLLANEVTLNFCLQFQTHPDTMPLDHATVQWDESVSKPIPVATLILHKQDIDQLGQPEYGENLSFNPWRTLAEHEPAGSISDARKIVYKASADLRRYINGIPPVEPSNAREIDQYNSIFNPPPT